MVITQFFKKLFSFGISLLIALLLLEGFFVLVYYINDGQYLPAEEKIQQLAPEEYRLTSAPSCLGHKELAPHPYLGFSRLAKPHCPNYKPGSGHTGEVFPRQYNPHKFTILFTGASVPKQLMVDARPRFGELLSKNYRYQGKEIVVLHGAVEAWKQPQQFILLMLNSHLVDSVITMEGFNELSAGITTDYQYDFFTPPLQTYQKANITSLSDKTIGFLWVAEASFSSVLSGNYLKHSKFICFLLQSLKSMAISASNRPSDHSLHQQEMSPFKVAGSPEYVERKNHFFNLYKRHIKNMHHLAISNNQKFIYFLQPIPEIDKPLTPQELSRAKKGLFVKQYSEMEKRLLDLRKNGIDVNSLTSVYRDFPETAYKDGIHLDTTGKAPLVLSQAMIEILAKRWGLEPIQKSQPHH